MASAGQAQAHSSQPTHFSRPSGWRLSTCRPGYRGLVTFGSNGYCSVVTLRKICANVTPNPWEGVGSTLSRTAGRLRAPVDRSISDPFRSGRWISDIAVLLDGGGPAPPGAHDRGAVGSDGLTPQAG